MSSMNIPTMPALEVSLDVWEQHAKAYARDCILALASKHGFNAEEEFACLGFENASLKIKAIEKKTGKKVRVEKVRVEKVREVKVPMPFMRETVVADGCCGLSLNRGLLTQCTKKRSTVSETYCDKCLSEANKNASGVPDCGTVAQRLAVDLYTFKDPKGRSPTSYAKVLENLKISKEVALEAAGKLGVSIPEEHFRAVEVEKKAGGRGRPKKPVTVVDSEVVQDLFASIAPDTDIVDDVVDEMGSSVEVIKPATPPASASKAEKEAKKDQIMEQRAAQKAALEAKKEAEKAAKKAEKEAEKAAKKAEKEAEKEAEKAEKAKAKEAKKAEKVSKKTVVAVASEPEPVAVAVEPVAVAVEPVAVEKAVEPQRQAVPEIYRPYAI
jgi:chemotaxis protein histidine kinase CheA